MTRLHTDRRRPAPASNTALARSVEQTLCAHRDGLPVRALIAEVQGREAIAGREVPDAHVVVRTVGLLMVEGRLDERGGLLQLCTDAGACAA